MKLKLKVFPKARQERLEEKGDLLKVYVKEPAIEGRANKRLIEILAKHLKLKKYQLKIIRGINSRERVVEVDGHS